MPDLPAAPARALIAWFRADGGALAALVLLAAASISVNSEARTERSARPPVHTCRSALGRCRAGSMVECILMLDYLPYYCLPLPLLTFTLAYVGLCSLLSKLIQC